MIKTFILNSDSHVEIDLGRDECGQLLLSVKIDEKAFRKTSKVRMLPAELGTERALRIWNICKEKKWVDDDFMPLLSQKRAAILASVISSELALNPKWTAFENLWHITNLANKLCKAQECSYYCDFIQMVEDTIV